MVEQQRNRWTIPTVTSIVLVAGMRRSPRLAEFNDADCGIIMAHMVKAVIDGQPHLVLYFTAYGKPLEFIMHCFSDVIWCYSWLDVKRVDTTGRGRWVVEMSKWWCGWVWVVAYGRIRCPCEFVYKWDWSSFRFYNAFARFNRVSRPFMSILRNIYEEFIMPQSRRSWLSQTLNRVVDKATLTLIEQLNSKERSTSASRFMFVVP